MVRVRMQLPTTILAILQMAVLSSCADVPTTAPIGNPIKPSGGAGLVVMVPPASAPTTITQEPSVGSYFRVGTGSTVYLYLGAGRSVGVPDWHTYKVCSGGGASLVRTLPAMYGDMVGVLPSAKQHRWMGSFRPIRRQNPVDGAIWFVAGCIRTGFHSEQAYVAANGTIEGATPWGRVETVDAIAYDALPELSSGIGHRPLPQRALIKWSGSPEVRLVVGPNLSLTMSGEIFESHCFDWGEIQTVSQATFNAYTVTGVLHHGGHACGPDDRFPVADGFDYPVTPLATATPVRYDTDRYYLAQGFRASTSSGYHDGEDWNGDGGGNTDCGDAVYAPANGWIVNRQHSTTGWGNALVIEHRLPDGRKTQTILAHHELLIRTHGVVRRGELIAVVGTTGNSGACHLHWGHRDTGDPNWNLFGAGYSSSTYPYMQSASQFANANRVLAIP
jgi:murein DD-endopeptidase MepM/ murein hydrolase activator NlpD